MKYIKMLQSAADCDVCVRFDKAIGTRGYSETDVLYELIDLFHFLGHTVTLWFAYNHLNKTK